MTAATPVHAVEMRGVSKHFGGVKALIDVDFQVEKGEIHALLGGNGAGKSTILKVLNGVHVPDSGTILVDGQPLAEVSPEAARRAGIAMIFQEMSLIPTLTVAQNVFLTREAKSGFGLIDDRTAERRARELFDILDVSVDPEALVGDLGAGQRQLTEIVKAISQDAKILVLDEPSTALSVHDVDRLFTFLRKLRAEGHAIIYVSHRMDEIARIADRATILRDGRHVITAPLSELPIETMIEHIVGKRSRGLSDVRREAHAIGDTLLELRNVSGEHIPRNVDLTVHRGEVVGIAGLLGSGRSSLARTMCGMSRMVEGEIRIAGKPVAITRPKDAIDAGLVLIPEDRIRQGVIAEHSVAFNTSLAVLDRLSGSGGFVKADEVRALTDRQIARLQIKTASRDHAVRTLSGGNQQKVVIAKWLSAEPEILVLDEPTSGIDIGSKSEILTLVRELAKAGKAVIMISSELSEILSACDRIVVMSDGRVMEDLPRAALDDPSAPTDDPVAQLQAAERNLQIAIQRALTASQSPAPRGTHVH
jgi:ribose transport system ATP-binding protein